MKDDISADRYAQVRWIISSQKVLYFITEKWKSFIKLKSNIFLSLVPP